jgi:photosystem II stability/assembly factor-like uncharacterized protein
VVVGYSLVGWHPITSGQGTIWVRTGGPSGGIGYDIKVHPSNPDIMYVTDALAGVHKSTNGGLTWVSINQGIDARVGPSKDHIPAFCVTIDPNNPDVIWVGMQEVRGVYRSASGGATWEKRTNGIVEEFGLTLRGITVQPGDSSVVYLAGETNSFNWAGQQRIGKEFDMVRGVVYKSTDGGQNWRAVWRGDNLARYVIVDPISPNTVYVSTGIFDREAANSRPEFNESGGVGILKSTDAGASWTTTNNGLPNLYVGSLFMHPRDPRTLLAATGNISYRDGGGIYVTTDAGDTWQYRAGDLITSVELSTGDPSIGYAAGSREFFRSTDGGQTWQAFLNRGGRSWGPEGILTGFPIDVQADPRDPRRVFVNNYGGGNFLTVDGGASWALASSGYTGAPVTAVAVSRQDPAVVYANTKSGPFRSRDGGETWVGINPVNLRPVSEGGRIAVDPEDHNHVLMSSAHQGLTFESTDAGDTWQLVTDYQEELQGTPGIRFQQGMQALVFAPSWRLKVYGGFGFQQCVLYHASCDTQTIVGVLTSEDGGRIWTRRTGTGLDTSSVPAIAIHPQNQDVAWAGTLGKGIFKTTDGGSRWTAASTGLGDLSVEALAVDPTRPDVLYAGTFSKGVYKSRDGGTTWAASSNGMKDTAEIKALVVHPRQPDVVYAGSYESGVYASTNAGASWALINNGLRNRAIRALSVSQDGSVLYAGTFGEGVFRLGTVTVSAGFRR